MHYLLYICEKKCKKQKQFLLLTIGVAPDFSPGFQREVELKKIILMTICVVMMFGCAVNRYRSDFEFANKLAAEGLWKEAYYRWQKAQTPNGGSAALHNNLAVALESLNRLPEAEQEYQQALKLYPGNVYIKSNYDRFQKNQGKEKGKAKNEK
jgi:tetratricopeptide (TPR) repeat protein